MTGGSASRSRKRRCSYVVITVSTTLAMMPCFRCSSPNFRCVASSDHSQRSPSCCCSCSRSASIVNRRPLSETISALQHVDALVLGGGSFAAGRHQFQKPSVLPDPLAGQPFGIASRSFFGDKDWVLCAASGADGVCGQRWAESRRSPGETPPRCIKPNNGDWACRW